MLSAIIPAYNEEKTIGKIVATLKKSPLVKEIIVIDDGSEDQTAKIAIEAGAKVIKLAKNQGKGMALKEGVKESRENTLLFLDADLVGLKREHIELLVRPVIENKLDMTVGSIDRGKIFSYFQKFESPFSGLRVLKKDFWQGIPEEFKTGYFIESALTYFAKKNQLRTQGILLPGLKHLVKEKKRGWFPGFYQRLKMFSEIVLANFLLRIHF